MKFDILITSYFLFSVFGYFAEGHWCHKCKGNDNESCLEKNRRCRDGDFCANSFTRTPDLSSFTMVRKRCAKNCRKPNELECNNDRTECSYCCQGEGCNREVLLPGNDTSNVTPSGPCTGSLCTSTQSTQSTQRPPRADQIQQILMSHHEHMRPRVAFSVHADAVTEGFGPHHVVRFLNIFTNVGNLFDGMSNLAELRIKKSGLYHLSVHVVSTDGGDSKLLTLKHNGHILLHSKPSMTEANYILPTGYIQTVLNLEKGDTIELSVERETAESSTSASDVIFNGYLIG